MTENIISPLLIQKLGHEIQEIRERALINISSKLEHGFVYDNDLARSKEILSKLFEWFLFEPCTKQQLVFSLIKRILQSESGKALINHHGTAVFKNELKQIRTFIEPKYYQHLDEIIQILNQSDVIVPPLETDVPLSYRTGTDFNSCRPVGTTATTIEGFIQRDSSASNRYGLQSGVDESNSPKSVHIISCLKWQSLIEPDRHILQSIENSLRNPPQPSSLLHSSDFFNNILLHDFPVEVFLQRPTIVLIFYNLIETCPSTRVTSSVLNCLCNLTKALQTRINFYNDPCMCNAKENVYSQVNSRCSSPSSSSKKSGFSSSDEEVERLENVEFLKTQQMSLPDYCFSTFKSVFKFLCVKSDTIQSAKSRTNQKGVNLALLLLEELVALVKLVLNQDIWLENPSLSKQINQVLIEYGATLEYFRVEAAGDESHRVTQLCFLHNCTNFLVKMIPLSQTGHLLPRNLKNALTNSLVDVILTKLYPDLYDTLLEYVQSFRAGIDSDSLIKYHETNKICDSITCAVQFMTNHKSLNAVEGINLAKKALPCLEFHKTESFVKFVIELAANKLSLYPYDDELLEKFEFVVLKLLAHNVEQIKQETYRLCQKRVISAIGPKLNTSCTGAPGAQILFLLKSSILIEIASHGLTSENIQIRNHSEDILIHVIKCKLLVSEDIWNKVVEALIGALPILLCHANKNSSLGRSLLNITDPDTAETLRLSKNEVIKANIQILFGLDVALREEAFSRLCWLLASQPDSREMLPRLNNLYDKALPNVCQIQRTWDVNKTRTTQHFYQPSSLQQVLDLLKSSNVEPVIRRSALTQTSVMMEDPLLHAIFLERGGIEVVLNVIRAALVEKNFNDYPDSVIPAISILKNLCLYHSSARQTLCVDSEVYYNVLRSLFLFFTEDKLKYDAVCLLFLLLFNDFVKGSPSKADFSLPSIVVQQLHVPFSCNTHWEISPYYDASLVAFLSADRWCLSSIQIQWNLEMFGGLDALLSWSKIPDNDVVELLKLKDYDLQCLKASSVDYYIKKYLAEIQNGVTHENVIASINKLTTYVHLSECVAKESNFLSHSWESTFIRFLKVLPSSEEDAKLLSNVLKFLKLLVPFYKSSKSVFWLTKFLKNGSNCILDLITLEPSSNEEFKVLSQDLLILVSLCASQEQHFFDFYTSTDTKISNIDPSWRSVIEIIANNLKFNDGTHFYNLSYLDSLVSCLVHLTATLGWSDSKPGSLPKRIFSQLIISLCELIVVFHCGKGPTSTISVMGLSITRHVIISLNHILAEMRHCKIKNWESCFMDVEEEWIKSFQVLWNSRDVVVRAGALQLFAGLVVSPVLAMNIVNELKNEKQGVCHLVLSRLIDHDEASVVKENCAYLLANLMRHTCQNHSNKYALVTSMIPNATKKANDVESIFDLFDEYQFNKNLVSILNGLYTNNIEDFDSKSVTHLLEYCSPNEDDYCDDSSSSKSSKGSASVVTPSFVKSIVNLLLSLFNLDEDKLSNKVQDFGLVKLLFRCVCNPSMSITDTKKLSLYCEILEMDISICSLLSQVAQVNKLCLGTLLHTKDCLNGVVSLLNSEIYHTHLPQLIYLRNKLWSEIFKLVSVLTVSEKSEICEEALGIISETITDSGREAFVETLCEATRSNRFDELQNSALLSLTSLLGIESRRVLKTDGDISDRSSIQNLLDTVHTSRTALFETETITSKPSEATEIMEKVFFEDHATGSDVEDVVNSIAGAQICKILLNLYDLCNLKVSKDLMRKKSMIASSLTSILCVSQEAKRYAFKRGLLNIIMKQLKDFYVKLSLESADCLRKVGDKKRVLPVLKELDEVIGLVTNFMMGDEKVKCKFAESGLSDLVHKLWIWFSLQKPSLIDVLKMLCTFTADCAAACQSLPLTSSVAGSGPRKVPSRISLLHAIIELIEKEMDLVSKTHSLTVLELSFLVLSNCCAVTECRILFCKSALLNSVTRLHPAITKKQKPWDAVEQMWLEFLQNFSLYPEGQSSIAKINDVFEILIALTNCSKSADNIISLLVLRNVAFYQPNRSRLLTSDDFLNLLRTKLDSGNAEEKSAVVLIMWSLAANNQKAKMVFKSAQLDKKLQQVLKHYQLSSNFISSNEIERIQYVLNVIRDGDKVL